MDGVCLTSKLRAIERSQCIVHRGLCFEFINIQWLTLPPWASPLATGKTNHYGAKAKGAGDRYLTREEHFLNKKRFFPQFPLPFRE